MITGSEDGSTKVLDLLEGRPIYTLVGHDDAVTAVAFSGDGSNFATASKDKQASTMFYKVDKIQFTIVMTIFMFLTSDYVVEVEYGHYEWQWLFISPW